MLLTMLAEVAGAILIVAVLPFSWSVRLVLVAVYLGGVHYASLAYLRRRGDG
jgi:purine-cytosine permease-like protein